MELLANVKSGVSKKTGKPYEIVEKYVELVIDGEKVKVQLEVSNYSKIYQKALEKRLLK